MGKEFMEKVTQIYEKTCLLVGKFIFWVVLIGFLAGASGLVDFNIEANKQEPSIEKAQAWKGI